MTRDGRAAVLEVAPFELSDLPHVLELLGRCSRATLYHRFHGVTDGVGWARGLATRSDARTVCAWVEGCCVGTASLGRRPDAPPEIGILVEDPWQRQGVGRALADHLIAGTAMQGASSFHADILVEDSFALSLLRRYGTTDVRIDGNVYSVEVELFAPTAAQD